MAGALRLYNTGSAGREYSSLRVEHETGVGFSFYVIDEEGKLSTDVVINAEQVQVLVDFLGREKTSSPTWEIEE